ncbi:acyl carrier protein [Sulfurimonas sp. HSL-1716]|uniref:acyl carrier protein n=1 Tax=Hydrocurvibacter sulfurireducens TaxID=3131937 RepID=UPI0031F9087D
MNEYKEFLISWICEKTGIEKNKIDSEINMFENGYVDSLSLFGLLLDIETNFGVTLDTDDILNDRAATVDGLSEILKNKSNS